jgi:hypothetical protein
MADREGWRIVVRPAAVALLIVGSCSKPSPSTTTPPSAGSSAAAPTLTPADAGTMGTDAQASTDADTRSGLRTTPPPSVAIESTTTENEKGEVPALKVVATGFPAFSHDRSTFVAFDAVDFWGHTTETRVDVIDVASLRTTKLSIARANERMGSVDGDAFALAMRATLMKRAKQANDTLSSRSWAGEASVVQWPLTSSDAGTVDGWKSIHMLDGVELQVRDAGDGGASELALYDRRSRKRTAVTPRWTEASAPQCGYSLGPKHEPPVIFFLAVVASDMIALGRKWQLGTHDCDGVPAKSSYAFSAR